MTNPAKRLKRKSSELLAPTTMPAAYPSPPTSDPTHEPNGTGQGESFESALTPRAKKRKEKKLEKRKPQFKFNPQNIRADRKIGIAHVRDLILFMVGDAKAPDWIVVEHKSQIRHVVVLLIPGLLPEHLGIPPIQASTTQPVSIYPSVYPSEEQPRTSSVPQLQTLFTLALPTRAPGDQRRMHSAIGMLLSSPLPEEQRKIREEKSKKIAEAAKADSFSPLPYLLTSNQMLENDYPLPFYLDESGAQQLPGTSTAQSSLIAAAVLRDPSEFNGLNGSDSVPPNGHGANGLPGTNGLDKRDAQWRETPQATGPPENGVHRILAIDCEMVLTTAGQELARISVIDFQSNLNIFDELVKPSRPITDYRTQWSGITPEKLATATHTLASIQDALLYGPDALITPHTVLLGHSLECDLNALKIRHALCIDTALLFRHPRGPPYKSALKYLAMKWLDREIQASVKGHDSEEDARACVDLLKLKMANGPDFGNFADRDESIFERLSRYTLPETETPPTTCFCDSSFNPRMGPGSKATTAPKCNGDEEVVDAIISNAPTHNLTMGRLADLSLALGWIDRDRKPRTDDLPSSQPNSPDPASPPTSVGEALLDLNDQLARLYTALPGDTALILLTGHGDPRPMKELAAKRQRWERQVKTLGGVEHVPREDRWMSGDDRDLEAKTMEAREGMSFFCVKASPASFGKEA